jgi:hypothetical protein
MQNVIYKRNCPECGKDIVYKSLASFRRVNSNSKCWYCSNVLRGKTSNRKGCKHTPETKMAISKQQTGRKLSLDTKSKMSKFQRQRYSNPNEVTKMALAVKNALHLPHIRKKHLDALAKTKWLKVKMDSGQLELIGKWNRLGFQFQPNYQLHLEKDLFYIDGYDPIHNIVLEYDSKYHEIMGQKQKDLIRQQKIINILHPKKFWRYNSVTKSCKNVLEELI